MEGDLYRAILYRQKTSPERFYGDVFALSNSLGTFFVSIELPWSDTGTGGLGIGGLGIAAVLPSCLIADMRVLSAA